MPPRPLSRVVIDRQFAFAIRAGEPGPGRMLNPDLNRSAATITDRCRCRSIPTNCLPSYSLIGATHIVLDVTPPSIRREPHEERRPRSLHHR